MGVVSFFANMVRLTLLLLALLCLLSSANASSAAPEDASGAVDSVSTMMAQLGESEQDKQAIQDIISHGWEEIDATAGGKKHPLPEAPEFGTDYSFKKPLAEELVEHK